MESGNAGDARVPRRRRHSPDGRSLSLLVPAGQRERDCQPAGRLVLAYDIAVLRGSETVGVVDGETGQWAAQVSLPQGSNVGQLYVSAPGANARVVVANCNVAAPMESEARLRRLELFEAEYADA